RKPIEKPAADEYTNLARQFATPNQSATQTQKEAEVEELKMKVERELPATSNQQALKQLKLFNTLQRLGVAYHFEKAIEETLQNMYDTHRYCDHKGKPDLYHTSIAFCIMR
ncbi:hypothetical protein Ancab_001446, partial [Ancistrocladus abbreviatus]